MFLGSARDGRRAGFEFEPVIEDNQTLNEWSLEGGRK